MTFEELEKVILIFPDGDLGRGATEEEVAAAEDTLGVEIRGGFRDFLRRFGWGEISYLSIYGLGIGIPPYLDLVQITMSERTEMSPRLPAHLVPVMNDGGGNLFCLDTSANMNEPPVVSWAHDEGESQTPVTIAQDFVSWLAAALEAES